MASNHAKIWAALKTYLEAYPDIPMVAYGGESFDPPDNTPYLIVDDVRFDATRVYYGSDAPTWQTGNLAVHCMIPLAWSDMQSAEYAGSIADYFKQDTRMSYEDVSVSVSKSPTVSGSGFRDGDRFRVPLLILWEGFV